MNTSAKCPGCGCTKVCECTAYVRNLEATLRKIAELSLSFKPICLAALGFANDAAGEQK